MKITVEQAAAIHHLTALFGGGTLRRNDSDVLDWIWFVTETQEWLIQDNGKVAGWNDLPASSRKLAQPQQGESGL